MRVLLSQVLCAGVTLAFPSHILEAVGQLYADKDLVERAQTNWPPTQLFEPVPIFNATEQYVDISPGSGHEWVAPGKTDLRGPCPGLNSFSNHGFLPHNGYATLAQIIDANVNVVGMGVDVATFLAALGGFLDGDGLAWSIGGTPSVAAAGVLGSQGHGLIGSHDKYENDASPCRGDLYQTGNNYKLLVNQFQEMIDTSPGGQVTINSLMKFRSQRFDYSIANNKYFFYGPFNGIVVQPAAYFFTFRFMANHSAEYPHGYLSYDSIATWFGVTGTSGNYKAHQGYERIPDNWYKRPLAYPYTAPYVAADIGNAALIYPKFLSVGGNTGKTNSFTGVNITDLTAGAFNGETLLNNNNFACLAFQFAAQAEPDIALTAIDTLTSALSSITSSLSCTKLQNINAAVLKKYPGYTKSGVDYGHSLL